MGDKIRIGLEHPVLSVRQPWAALIVAGIKDIENRSWIPWVKPGTEILIHASATPDLVAMNTLPSYLGATFNNTERVELQKLVDLRSAIIGKVEITGWSRNAGEWSKWAEEGAVHWHLKNGRPIDPIENVRGQLGFWRYTKFLGEIDGAL